MPHRAGGRVDRTTLQQIDDQLARLTPGRHDPRCQRWIDELLEKRQAITEGTDL